MPLYSPTRPPFPNPAAGQYALATSPGGATTSAVLGNGTLRLSPWLIESTLRIDRLGGDVSATGEAGSKVRLGIYGDNGAAYPGALLLDGGQIAGDSATVQELTVALTLPPGLYWIGGAVQSAPSSQPTVRIASGWFSPVMLGQGASILSAAGTVIGYSQASVTGALPASFTAGSTGAGVVPRLFVRAA